MPTRRSLVVLGLASLLASASFRCGSGHRTSDGGGADRVSPGNVSSQGEQANGTCPTQPRKLLGTSAAQSSCGTFAECAPSCCGCPSGLDSWLAAACIDGRCADRATVCATTLSATWCSSYLPGDGGPEASPADEGTFPSREAGSSAGCVEGDYYSCSGTGEHWTGALCCVDGPVECVEGDYYSCSGTGEHWTGTLCCVDGPAACVEGDYYSCSGTGEHWTGKLCCVTSG